MKVFAATAALLFLATALSAQGPEAEVSQAKANLTAKQIKHLEKVKKEALRLDELEWVYIHLTDHTQVLGQVTNISNDGVRFTESSIKRAGHRGRWSSHRLSPRLIPFSQIQRIGPSVSDQMQYFSLAAMSSAVGPLGWWVEWMILTGRD